MMRQSKKPQSIHSYPTGPTMSQWLKEVGIHAQKVVRQRETGHYIADFFVPGMETPIRPARDWATLLQERLGELRIISTNDAVADWRSDRPVIWATVTFALDTLEAPQPQRRAQVRWLNG